MSHKEVTEFMKVGHEVVERLPKDKDEQPLIGDVGLCDIFFAMAEGYLRSEMYKDNTLLVVKSLEAEGETDPDKVMEEYLKMHLHTFAHRAFDIGVGFCIMKEIR